MPMNIVLSFEPKLKLRIVDFSKATSIYDMDQFSYKPSDYLPSEVHWMGGSKGWDIYALSMIIYEWYLRKNHFLDD